MPADALSRPLPNAPTLVITMVITLAISLASPGVFRDSSDTRIASAWADPGCDNSCRGLGIEKVKAGDDHCGLVPRARKDESLDAACRLAAAHREELQRRAEERAREKCDDELDQSDCSCRITLHDWQNVYTHVLSQRCWTECGWAALVECERHGDGEGDAGQG